MSKECFDKLCERIMNAVGEKMSEEYMFYSGTIDSNMHGASLMTTGGIICGEVKLALTLRMLAGGSYLDISLIYHLGFFSSVYHVFHHVIQNWINNDEVICFLGDDYVHNRDEMRKVAMKFRQNGRHDGVISRCIGAIDGWLVRIQAPSLLNGKHCSW